MCRTFVQPKRAIALFGLAMLVEIRMLIARYQWQDRERKRIDHPDDGA